MVGDATHSNASGGKKRSKKRTAVEQFTALRKSKTVGDRGVAVDDIEEELQFEDEFEDEFEEEGEPLDAQGGEIEPEELPEKRGNKGNVQVQRRIFRPDLDMREDEQLVHDPSAYDMLHTVQVEWPALSFDCLQDRISGSRSAYPMTAYCVLGTQADKASKNQVVVAKMSQMYKTRKRRKPAGEDEDEEDEDEESESEDERGECMLENMSVKHDGGVNRIRAMPQIQNIVATWSENGRVYVYDIEPCLDALDRGSRMPHPDAVKPSAVRPFFTCNIHKDEGFAMDWSRLVEGRLATGANNGSMYLWEPRDDSRFQVDATTFRGHTASIEDIQWSPSEASVFASCSADRSIQFWDVRVGRKPALAVRESHEKDVNVISWNRIDTHLLLSGSDDGALKVWDLRALKDSGSEPAAFFGFHRQPITSVEWHPTQSSMLAASSDDNSVSLWDLSVERDPEEEAAMGEVLPGADELPPQLLFLHMGQRHIKEIHWHPKLPSVLVSTAEDGLNIFRVADVF